MNPEVMASPNGSSVEIWVQDAVDASPSGRTVDLRRCTISLEQAQKLWEELSGVIDSIRESAEINTPHPSDAYLELTA